MISTLKRHCIFIQLFVFNCFLSNLCGMDVGFYTKTINEQVCSSKSACKAPNIANVETNPITLDDMISGVIPLKILYGLLLKNYFITSEEYMLLMVKDIRGWEKETGAHSLRKEACEKLFNAIKGCNQGVRLSGSLTDVYESIQPNDCNRRLGEFTNILQIANSGLSMHDMAYAIKLYVNNMQKNRNKFLEICGVTNDGQHYYNNAEIWFIYSFYVFVVSPLAFNDYFSIAKI